MRSIEERAITRRTALALGMAACALPRRARAAWPTQPVSLVVGFPPGGPNDLSARLIRPGLQAALGQPVAIENRAGSNGNVAAAAVQCAAPDGHTLLLASASEVVNAFTMPAGAVDLRALEPVGLILSGGYVLCVHPSNPARDMRQFGAWLRAQPGALYGSAGTGSLQHVAMEMLRRHLGDPDMRHAPYRGAGQAMQDLLDDVLGAVFLSSAIAGPLLRSGRLRGLMVTTARRNPAFPDVPTAAEQGIEDFVVAAWTGLFAPQGTPREIVERANAALNQACRDPKIIERLASTGDEPGGGTPEQLGDILRRDHARWGEVVQARNIRAE